jgi:hypothetical protein
MHSSGTAGTAPPAPYSAYVVGSGYVALLVSILTSLALSHIASPASICSFDGPSLTARDDYPYPFRLILDNTSPIWVLPYHHTLQYFPITHFLPKISLGL